MKRRMFLVFYFLALLTDHFNIKIESLNLTLLLYDPRLCKNLKPSAVRSIWKEGFYTIDNVYNPRRDATIIPNSKICNLKFVSRKYNTSTPKQCQRSKVEERCNIV